MGLWEDVWKGGFVPPKGMSNNELMGYLGRKRVLFYEAAIKGVIEQNEKIIEQNEEILKLLKKEKND